MDREDQWKLFFDTGLPEAYTYMKARERKTDQSDNKHPDEKPRRG